MLSLFHIYPFPSFQPYQSIIPPKLYIIYIHLFIQLDSFTICTLVYIIITIILFLHLHFTITFRQTTNSACAHQLRLAPQYDMHITSIYSNCTRYDVPTREVDKAYKRGEHMRLLMRKI